MRDSDADDSAIEHQVFKNKQKNTDKNGGICDIECRPVVGTDVKIEKINDKSKPDPIDQISNCATGNQGQSHSVQSTVAAVTSLEQPDQNQGDQGGANKKHLPPQRWLASQDTEGRAVIRQIGQIEKPGQNRSAFKEYKIIEHPELTTLVY